MKTATTEGLTFDIANAFSKYGTAVAPSAMYKVSHQIIGSKAAASTVDRETIPSGTQTRLAKINTHIIERKAPFLVITFFEVAT